MQTKELIKELKKLPQDLSIEKIEKHYNEENQPFWFTIDWSENKNHFEGGKCIYLTKTKQL